MSAEAISLQWTPRDSVEAGILASVQAGDRLFPKPAQQWQAYLSAAEEYNRCDLPPEPHSSSSVIGLLLRTGEKKQVEHGLAMMAEVTEPDKQPELVRESLQAVEKWDQNIHRHMRNGNAIGSIALAGSVTSGILAVTNDGSFVAISVLTGVFAGFGYAKAMLGKMKLMQIESGTKLLKEHYSHLTLQASTEPQPEEMQLQSQTEEVTAYGELSEVIVADIDGKKQEVRVYWQTVDEHWTRYTSVLEDGTVLHSEASPRYPILTEDFSKGHAR